MLYNNVASEQAPGLNEYEKSIFLTKAQDEIVKNYFSSKSKGNNLGQGYDDSIKRQADFSSVMSTDKCYATVDNLQQNPVSIQFTLPLDLFIPVNEMVHTKDGRVLQVIPLRYDEYTRLMSKPFKRPLKSQAWRVVSRSARHDNYSTEKTVELVVNDSDNVDYYWIRYVRTLDPIILEELEDGLSIKGISAKTECLLDPMLHEDILQRAVELAKVSWIASNSNDNMQIITQLGQRSE